MTEPVRLNLVEIETRWGYHSFELYQGDMTKFSQPIDVLVVSALANDLDLLKANPEAYQSVQHTVIGALYSRAQVDVAALREERELDLRAALGCWVSRRTSSPVFRRIVCLEGIGIDRPIGESVDNVFVTLGVLDAKQVEVRTILLPVLGTGGMRLDPEPVVKALLDSAHHHLPRLGKLERILFVTLDPGKAESLSRAMDRVLGRAKVLVPKGELVAGIRRDILRRIETALGAFADRGAEVLLDFRRIIANDQSRSFEIAVASRRLVELVVRSVAGARLGRPLMNAIDDLSQHEVADWIRSYMHTVRVFGNESAHDKGQHKRHPSAVAEADVALCLLCVLRILEFWIEYRTEKRLLPR
jgi:hypothetical protein